jgi:hypothetical protein
VLLVASSDLINIAINRTMSCDYAVRLRDSDRVSSVGCAIISLMRETAEKS